MRPGCCEHCETVGEMMELVRRMDRRQDAMSLSLAKLSVNFRLVKQLVFGAVGVMLVAVMGVVGQAVAATVSGWFK